jgi:hypothetical protein
VSVLEELRARLEEADQHLVGLLETPEHQRLMMFDWDLLIEDAQWEWARLEEAITGVLQGPLQAGEVCLCQYRAEAGNPGCPAHRNLKPKETP